MVGNVNVPARFICEGIRCTGAGLSVVNVHYGTLAFSLTLFILLVSLGIQEFPENIKNCKVLAIVEASVNPISK